MIYKCEKCNKIFNQKIHYMMHLKRKKPCVKIIDSNIKHQNEENNDVNKVLTNVNKTEKMLTKC